MQERSQRDDHSMSDADPGGAGGGEVAREVARILLRVGAVSINARQPFTYTSGIVSPIYTDNRLLISYPEERDLIAAELSRQIVERGGAEGADVVAGTATAGIPWAAWVAAQLHKPLIYVRPNPKEHGRARQIEGRLRGAERVVVVEDLISTGTSSLQTVESIRQAGGAVSECVAIFSYEFKEALRGYQDRSVRLSALTTISTLLDVALSEGFIDQEDERAVLEWIAPHR